MRTRTLLAASLLVAGCAVRQKVAPPLSSQESAVLLADVVDFVKKELPVAKTTLLFDGATQDVFVIGVQGACAKLGYAVGELKQQKAVPGGVILRPMVLPGGNAFLLRVQLGGSEMSRLYHRTAQGLQTQGPRLVRRGDS